MRLLSSLHEIPAGLLCSLEVAGSNHVQVRPEIQSSVWYITRELSSSMPINDTVPNRSQRCEIQRHTGICFVHFALANWWHVQLVDNQKIRYDDWKHLKKGKFSMELQAYTAHTLSSRGVSSRANDPTVRPTSAAVAYCKNDEKEWPSAWKDIG